MTRHLKRCPECGAGPIIRIKRPSGQWALAWAKRRRKRHNGVCLYCGFRRPAK